MNAALRLPTPISDMSTAAQAAIDAVIERGAHILRQQPWRADRIIPGAHQMTSEEILRVVDRILPNCRDFNRKLALQQLRRAAPDLGPVWAREG